MINYKKIIKNRNLRLKILNLLSWIPDKTMIKIQYRIKTGRKLNLKNPKRYTEKLQWYKLYYRDPLMVKCVDKYEVREYVKKCGLEKILNDCYGVYNSPEEIDFKVLPNEFVLKDTLGGGGNSIIICEDKNKANIKEYEKIMNKWINTKKIKTGGREWPYYKGKKHRIICEKLIQRDENNDLRDYKFFCFNGKVKYIYIIKDRFKGKKPKIGIFNEKGQKLEYYRKDENKLLETIDIPNALKKMKTIAEKISSKFPHVRVDLYYSNEKIIFGELTFFDGSGYMTFEPDKFDYFLGEEFTIKGEKNE